MEIAMDFFSRIASSWTERRTLLCVGLDPRVEASEDDPEKAAAAILEKNRRLIDATAKYAACYKPNAAFYEAWGAAGWDALAATIEYVPKGIPVLLDAKRGDIDTTAKAYAQALFKVLGADAVTLNPYMGRDAVDPFLEYPDAGLFLLCRTSNPRAGVFQDAPVGGEPLYLKVARECSSWSDRVGLVVAGNDIEALGAVRAVAPNAWFLAPGIGAQGGDIAQAWRAGAREDGLGVIPAVSRAVADAADPGAAAASLCAAAQAAYEEVLEERVSGKKRTRPFASASERVSCGQKRESAPQTGSSLKERLLRGLVDAGCFRVGDFVLKSGIHSPFYIDLRRVVSDVTVLEAAAEAYATLARDVVYDRLGGIPAAALPLATAASLFVRKPLVWPRMPVKDHGTGNRVEGEFRSGERILLLDDLITTGKSKLEAAEILRGEGLVVEDLAVLIERGVQGRKDMEAAGIRLHAFLHVRELISLCVSLGLVSGEKGREMEAFAASE
jgi:uridine monophosphate synthetase